MEEDALACKLKHELPNVEIGGIVVNFVERSIVKRSRVRVFVVINNLRECCE
jgi:hypothetical protein